MYGNSIWKGKLWKMDHAIHHWSPDNHLKDKLYKAINSTSPHSIDTELYDVVRFTCKKECYDYLHRLKQTPPRDADINNEWIRVGLDGI